MKKKTKRFLTSLPRRVGGLTLSVTMVAGSLHNDSLSVSAASTGSYWKSDVMTALQELSDAEVGANAYGEATDALQEAYDSLVGAKSVENLCVTAVTEDTITLEWSTFEDESLVGYNVYWSDSNAETAVYQLLDADSNNCYDETKCTIDAATLDGTRESVTFEVKMSTNKNHWFKVAPVTQVGAGSKSEAVMSPTAVAYTTQLENLGRGLTVTMTQNGAYLNWRLLASELDGGYTETGLTGLDFNIYRGEELIATVTDSTNYLDKENTSELTDSTYRLVPVKDGVELSNEAASVYDIFTADTANTNVAYTDIPLQQPSNTTIAETYGVDSIALGGYTMTDSGYTSADDVITYSANDMSVGDVDGDGEYEYLVQWEPSLSKDVSQQGYTGKTYIDCYELDGTLLWRLDLGINIRAGAHYTQFGLYDYDSDGKAELMLKTAPGTKMTKYALDAEGKNIWEGSSLKVASTDYVNQTASGKAQGATDDSNYVFSAADYREYLIEVFQDWGVWSRYSAKTVSDAIDGHWSDNLVEMFTTSDKWSDSTFYTGEVASSANVTLSMGSMTVEDIQKYIPDYEDGDMLVNVALRDENGNLRYVSNTSGVNPVMKTVKVEEVIDYYGGYDLALVNKDVKDLGYTKEEATILADYYLNHYQYRMKKHNLNTWEGYVVTGPEYITLYGGDGTELDTQDWYYGREDDGMLWGDYAMNYIEPGNRVDRFNVAVAYLDGETPSCIMGRGYYTRTTMAAYNVVNKKLQLAGAIDSGWTVMSNPFNDGPHGFDGCDEKNGRLSGQGDHYIAVADVDGDGRQDIVNGGAIVSYKNGELYLYSSGGDYLKGGTGDTWAKYGHGDAIHITDVDPDHPGLEIVSCFEGGAYAPYNWAVRDAKSNKVLFGAPGTTDFGRITIGDVLTGVRGLEIDTGYDAKGNSVSLTGTSNNMNIKWSANMSTQFISGTTNTTMIGNVDGKSYTFLNASGYSTNNGTKGNPGLVADIFGDAREELILRKADSSSLRIYMNTEVNEHKNYTLMHNAQYRVGIASQNSAYNQPAYTDYYYASDTDWSRVLIPNTPSDQEPGAVVVNPASVSINTTSKTLLPGETLQLEATVIPSAADQKVTWTSDKEEVAKVDANGLVTAVSNGMAYITATTANEKTVTCKVSVVGDYKDDGLDKMPIGASYTFLFGSQENATGTEKAVQADSTYDSQKGYGWAESSHVTLTEGTDYVGATNYRSTDATPVYEYPTFEIDVPVGIYEVTIVQGTNGSEAAVNGAYVEGNKYSVRWSTENFATSYTEPTEDSWIWTQPGETKTTVVNTAVADGKLTINFATSLTNEGVSGTIYIKEVIVTRKAQITTPSTQPTLRFIGDSTLAKYPPEDGGTWTPIPERTGWGEDFSMGKFMDDDVVLVNKAVAGSSVKSYIYDGYFNDFLMTSHPGDTVIIEGGINDSAAGPRYSTADEFKTTLQYVIACCQAFGLDVILSSGTSSTTTYTEPMKALAEENGLHYVDLATQWTAYQSAVGTTQGNMTVDGTHLRRVGGIVAAQLVANDIADIEGLYISGHVNKTAVNYAKPSAVVTGLYAKTQTQGSVTLAWNIEEDTLYDVKQLITGFNVYRKEKGASTEAKLVATQTAYVSAGMNGPQLYTTVEMPDTGAYTFTVTCVGLTGESAASATVDVEAFVPDARYTLQDLIEKYETQFYDASVYTVASYATVKVALEKGKQVLSKADATDEEIRKALEDVQNAIAELQLNATTLERTDFQDEALTTAPWNVSGSHKTLLSAEMEADGNRLLNLYVEAAGSRSVNKIFTGASDVNAAMELVEFVWYPGNPDQRNVTEVEFYSTDANRMLSLKTASNGHIGYVTGNYPSDSTAYMTGTGFHEYADSKAVDLGLTNEAWYNVKIVFNYASQTADLYIEPRDYASGEGAVVKGIAIDSNGSNTVTKLNFLLMRGKQDNGTSNDLSILWDSYYDDYAMYYADSVTSPDKTEFAAALSTYESKTKGLSSTILSGEQFVLAEAVADIMTKDIGFFTAEDYKYAADVLKEAANAAPDFVKATSIQLQADAEQVTAGMTANLTALLNEGANEELVWSSSDEDIATVTGNGTQAVVLAKQAGTVTISAAGQSSGVTGELSLTVTGEAYFFGKDMIETASYTVEKGYGFKDYTYPVSAQGWTSGISPDGDAYVARALVETNQVSYLNASDSGEDYVAVNGQNWTEMPEGGRDEDKVPYQNTSAFVVDKENGNYVVSVTFYNPNKTTATAQVIAENIVRYAAGDHATAELASTTVAAGQMATVTFPLALTDKQLTLRFVQNIADGSYESAANRTVYVKSVSVDSYNSEQSADRDKTAILIAGDSTVQSYADKNYRTSWAQLLYQLFGTTVENGVNDGSNTGYATYETEDTYIVNYARDARSTKSFAEEGRFNELLLNIQQGDYVFMQFAHNDDNQARSNRFVSVADFKKNIAAYNQAVAERGGTLVLVTPICLGVWNEGVLDHRFDDYRMAMLESGLPVLDLMGATLGLLAEMGETNCNTIGIYKDTVHTYEAGAILYQRLLGNLLLASTDDKLAGVQALMNVEAPTDGIHMNVDSELMYIGDTASIKVEVGNTAISPIAAYSAKNVTFLTSDKDIVNVTADGKLTAGSKNGKAVITASYTTGDLATTDCTAYADYLVIEVTDDASRFEKEDPNDKPDDKPEDKPGEDSKPETGENTGNTENSSTETNTDTNTDSTASAQNSQSSQNQTSSSLEVITDETVPLASNEGEDNTQKDSQEVYLSPATYDVSWNSFGRRAEAAYDINHTKSTYATDEIEVYTGDEAKKEGMQTSPLEDYQFDFGYKNGNAPSPFISIVADAYTEEKGYGFISDPSGFAGSHVANHRDDNVVAAGSSDYDMALYAAVKDGARQESWDFAIDLPAGEYMVKIYVGAGTNKVFSGASYAVNGVTVCDSYTLPYQAVGDSYTVEDACISARVVLKEDGQVVVNGTKAGSLALISAITVNEFVEKTDAYSEEAWSALDTAAAALALKAGFFADDSTPFDYDVILVDRMVATLDALEAVKYMPLADTTDGEALYELCEETIENKSLYTETSIELLSEAMEAYEEALAALDIRDVVKETYEVIEFWLTGVETEYEEKPYAGYFDFNTTQTGGSAYNDDLVWEASGWTPVGIAEGHPELTLYSEERGYGMAAASVGRHRNTGDAVMDDFMIGGVFKVDLPAGDYEVTTYTGDLATGCKGSASYKFYTGYENAENPGELIASLAKETASAAEILERKVTFTLEEAATVTMVAAENGYTNAVIFEQSMDAQIESYDVETLAALVKEIDEQKLVETDYTLSTWKAFKEAYDEAKKAVENGASFAQQIATIETRLQEAYEALTLRVADGQYAIDFGPEQESDTVAAQVATNILLSGYAPDSVTLLKENELVLGSALYEDHVNDNGLHYGFTGEVASGFTATGGAYFRDWVYGKGGREYTFKADLPSGQYLVYVYTGCKEAANTTKFYFNGGEAAIATTNTSYTVTDGKAVYTQTSSAGGQFAAPGCIYTVQVAPNGDALGYVKDVEMGTLSLTLFDDSEGLASDAVTARLCGLGICRIGDYDPDAVVSLTAEEAEEEETTEEETTEEETTEEETTEEETTEEETTEEEMTEEETTEVETTEEETTEKMTETVIKEESVPQTEKATEEESQEVAETQEE